MSEVRLALQMGVPKTGETTLAKPPYTIRRTTLADASAVLGMINNVPEANSVLPLEMGELEQWIAEGRSYVATLDGTDEVIGHQGFHRWEGCGWYEVRSAVVKVDQRGHGINTKMKMVVMDEIRTADPDAKFVAFTEDGSKSRGIVQKLGYQEVSMDTVPGEFFNICPEGCDRGATCGCKVYVLEPQGVLFNGKAK